LLILPKQATIAITKARNNCQCYQNKQQLLMLPKHAHVNISVLLLGMDASRGLFLLSPRPSRL